jgi:hypothetical protein
MRAARGIAPAAQLKELDRCRLIVASLWDRFDDVRRFAFNPTIRTFLFLSAHVNYDIYRKLEVK